MLKPVSFLDNIINVERSAYPKVDIYIYILLREDRRQKNTNKKNNKTMTA